MKKVISFDLQAPFAVFKKPDINKSLYLTYNMLHRPALLGILGAIVGLRGFWRNPELLPADVDESDWEEALLENPALPEYYKKFYDLRVGIEPLESDNGYFQKTVIGYNNSAGYATNEEGGILQVKEQTLIAPSYRCYLLLDLENPDEEKLYHFIKSGQAEYLPYFGKNEFSAWWKWWEEGAVCEYSPEEFHNDKDFEVTGLFIKAKAVREEALPPKIVLRGEAKRIFMYFEGLPVSYHPALFQYEMADFVLANLTFQAGSTIPDLYRLTSPNGESKYVQLFNRQTFLKTIVHENAG
jgi:CRISPR-associated protein Cas5h